MGIHLSDGISEGVFSVIVLAQKWLFFLSYYHIFDYAYLSGLDSCPACSIGCSFFGFVFLNLQLYNYIKVLS